MKTPAEVVSGGAVYGSTLARKSRMNTNRENIIQQLRHKVNTF